MLNLSNSTHKRKAGFNAFVIETPTGLPIIIERSRALGIEPTIGVRPKHAQVGARIRPAEIAVFGLTATQLIEVVDRLPMLHCLQL